MTPEERIVKIWWKFCLILATFLLSFLLGAFASDMDARQHGLPVPHLWQKYHEFKCEERP